jgi:hypothetical protein
MGAWSVAGCPILRRLEKRDLNKEIAEEAESWGLACEPSAPWKWGKGGKVEWQRVV